MSGRAAEAGSPHGRGPVRGERAAQVAGERGRCRVVEDEGGGEAQSGGGGEPVAHLDGREGVEAEFLEGAVDDDPLGAAVAEYGRGVGAYGVEDQFLLLVGGQAGDPVRERLGGGGRPVGSAAGPGVVADQVPQEGGYGRCGAQGRVVEPDGHLEGRAGRLGGVEQREAFGVGEGHDAAAGEAAVHAALVEVSCHPAVARPQAPGEGDAGQAQRAPVAA